MGLQGTDNFAVAGTPTAAFLTPEVGNGKPVTVSGFTAPSANYTVTQPSGLSANITPAVNLDTDGDGLTDGQEATLGSNPTNAMSLPKTKLVYWGPSTGVAAAAFPTNLPSDLVKISAGENFALALSSAGRVYAWGANESGQTNVPAAALSGVVDILAAGGAGYGGGFAYARKADGSVVGWGSSASIANLPGNIVKMAGWGNQGLLLDSSGRAYQRGPDNSGTANVNSDSAWQSGLTDIGAARYNHIAVKAGAARVVGISNHNSLVVPTEAQANVQSVISHGGSTQTAILSNNQVVMWGKNDSTQVVGLKNLVDAGSLPGVSVSRYTAGTAANAELVLSQTGTPAIRRFFATQGYWTGLIDKDGKIWAWGNASTPTAAVPVAMASKVVQAVGGGNFALALVLDQDGDGLADNVETNTGIYVSADNTGTDPARADTDGDGLNDGVETRTGTFVSASNTGTDPLLADTDGDGTSDGVEVAAGKDPNVAPRTEIRLAAGFQHYLRLRWCWHAAQCQWERGQRQPTRGGGFRHLPASGSFPQGPRQTRGQVLCGVEGGWNRCRCRRRPVHGRAGSAVLRRAGQRPERLRLL
ncbi:MAG: hypothetical protein EBT77_06260 [Verrucomicrobia bacterium]|nr:hypothetical protein [Verrucomicrobiota bacterium]